MITLFELAPWLFTPVLQSVLVAGAVSTIVGGALWWREHTHGAVLPALPSHADAVQGSNEGTRFFGAVHDLTMAVTAAWNAVNARSTAAVVEEVIQRDELRRCLAELESAGEMLRARLHPTTQAVMGARPCLEALNAAWTTRVQHHHRTEHYVEWYTDSKGQRRSRNKTRQVYDGSDHWFEYDDVRATRASELADRWSQALTPVWWRPNLPDQEVDVAALDPLERGYLERLVRSTVVEDQDAEVTDQQLHVAANQWLVGNRLDEHLKRLQRASTGAQESYPIRFRSILQAKPSYHWRTHSRTHEGPEAYQATQQLIAFFETAEEAWAEVDTLLSDCVQAARSLTQWAEDPSTIESDRAYAELAIATYQQAFPDSNLDLAQLPRLGPVVVASAFVGLLTMVATYLLHPSGFDLLH